MYSINVRCNMALFVKMFFFLFFLVILYGCFLYIKISFFINGKVWDLPISVYSRIITLEPGSCYSKREMISILKGIRYRRVSILKQSGEFLVNKKTIVLIRRAFNFPDGREEKIHVKLYFDNNVLIKIKNLSNNHNFGVFRLDPQLITMLDPPNGEQRLFLSRKYYPKMLIDILLTTEDRYFYRHDGINIYSIIRAFLVNMESGGAIQGGSTLTQQLVKNLFLTNTRSLLRKINEIYMALIMDWKYSKDRILELYLNEVYLGQDGNKQIRGFPLASLYYFGCPINELRLDQYAVLVGMMKGASLYNPWKNPKIVFNRRNVVLHMLLQQNVINKNLYSSLIEKPVKIQPRGKIISPQSSFIQIIKNELKEKLGNKFKCLSGTKIFTTLDLVSQTSAERAVEYVIPLLNKKENLSDLETAIVIVDKFNGEIQGVLGSAHSKILGYNRAIQARRSIGSLSKPITYLTALSKPDKFNLNTWILDEPISIKLQNGTLWKPKNNNFKFMRKVMLIDALTYSINIPTVNLGMQLGLDQLVKTWIRLGLNCNQVFAIPAMSLGSINLTPIEVAKVFQVIASGGNRSNLSSIRSIISENGTVLYNSFPQSEKVASAQSSYLTLYAMQSVVKNGTAQQLGLLFKDYFLAGKTGTTNNLVDSWFIGIDGKQVVIVWVGRDNNKSTNLYGSSGAMQVYRHYLKFYKPKPLILVPPAEINILHVNFKGDIVCDINVRDKFYRDLPIWNKNGSISCN
ncbi:bifunctional glycosyl transferase/transpeptidase [Buchnera aphidicola]|uniref:Penicillin-binding protein 1B n=1 Tax=Buchnera aphidicola subsp. Melaphis rhois TaxID=118103 RepID=A0A4D6YC55_BUCMH|nr:bifunctional glycosyl transferase/transpeptidase [Buchnera aphidicola]QCI23220.1 bifunctional glycosyl transferase/transpeptidase [Buchnera aphidicola (Melaphis rhois)]